MAKEKRNLIIGAASKYDLDDLLPWIKSAMIAKHGDVDVALVVTDMTKNTIKAIENLGVKVYPYGTDMGDRYQLNSTMAPHVIRFFYLAHFLREMGSEDMEYEYVCLTDTRDVIFQMDPFSVFIDDSKLYIAPEYMNYQNEPWGNQNYKDTFGQYYFEQIKNRMIFNVGVMAGDIELVAMMCDNIFQASYTRPHKIVDQAVYNYLIYSTPWMWHTYLMGCDSVVNLGTTPMATKGDISLLTDAERAERYFGPELEIRYTGNKPLFAMVDHNLNKTHIPAIVHQWDRINSSIEVGIRTYYGGHETV